jgi:hypothetical protein
MAAEKALDKPVTDVLKKGGKSAEMLKALSAPPSNVVKKPGGNFLLGRTEKDLQPLKRNVTTRAIENGRYTPEQIAQLAESPRVKANDALNNWVDTTLTNYVRKQMGTPDDPVRKLAEQGITHKPALLRDDPYLSTDPLRKQRTEAGFPEEGMGQSPAAKAWEQASDEAIAMYKAGDIQIAQNPDKNPFTESWTERYLDIAAENPYIAKLDPNTPTYTSFTSNLGFDHIMDVLREDVTTGRIRPEQLSKVSMADAVRRTHQYDQELAAKMNAARTAAREGLPVYKEYPKGYRWIQLNKPGSFAQESDAMGHSVRGYEPPIGHPDWTAASGDAGSPSYGHGGWEAIKSGKAKVYSLVDSKGAPHATVEVKTKGVLTDNDFGANDARIAEGRGDFGERGYRTTDNQFFEGYADAVAHEKAIQKPTPQELAQPASITQIKGKGNRAPNEEYLPYIQDFVRGGQWSDVRDIQNTGMRPTTSVFSDQDMQMLREAGETNIPQALLGEEIQRLHNLIVPEGKRLKYSPEGNIIGMEGEFAHGGAVLRRHNKGGSVNNNMAFIKAHS